MRVLALLIIGSAVASCTAAPPAGYAAAASAQDQARLQQELAGWVPAGPPQSCLPPGPSWDSTNVGEHTIVFRRGSAAYVNHPPGGCAGLGNPSFALVTKSVGMGPCQGDFAQVMDLQTHAMVGACSLGEFIPYRRGS